VTASTTIEAAPQAVFAVLAVPSARTDIGGTGWVREFLDGDRINGAGQVFRMAMYHEDHPDKDYKIANQARCPTSRGPSRATPVKSRPRPGKSASAAGSDATTPRRPARRQRRFMVTLTYDWSAVPPQAARVPPVPADRAGHLDGTDAMKERGLRSSWDPRHETLRASYSYPG
jgi:hypothetical protein